MSLQTDSRSSTPPELYEYKTVHVENDVGAEAQDYANQGWRVVSVFPTARPGYFDVTAFELLLERRKTNPYDKEKETASWYGWEEQYGKYYGQKTPEHNHPLGVVCGESCPVLRGRA